MTHAERRELLALKMHAAAEHVTQVPVGDLVGTVKAIRAFTADAGRELDAILNELE
jgi:hypothetical protein